VGGSRAADGSSGDDRWSTSELRICRSAARPWSRPASTTTSKGWAARDGEHPRRSRPMRLTEDEARTRLAAHDHGILCTVHAERGVDAVPVAYVVEDGYVGVPVDRVKPKTASRLQRERNLEADARATLL